MTIDLTDNQIEKLSKADNDRCILDKIKLDIARYELDCRFADHSQSDECAICNKNVFGSIYRIIDKYIEGGESHEKESTCISRNST